MLLLLYKESIQRDMEEQHEFARNYSILIGSFTNAEMAGRLTSLENPDFESTEEDFDESTRMVIESRNNKSTDRRRRRRVING